MLPQLFHRKSTGTSDKAAGVPRAEFEALEAKCDRLESQLKLIRTEWNDVYDKVAHLYDRTRKRIQALKRAEDRSESTNGAPEADQPTHPKTHAEILHVWRGMQQRR